MKSTFVKAQPVQRRHSRLRRLSVMAAICVAFTCCTTSQEARDVKPSGFLGASASLLRPAEKDEFGLLVYRKKGTDWASYKRVILDPVAIWGSESAKLSPDELSDYQKLVDNFYLTFKDKLSKDYVITDTPGAGTMRIQAAIINGEQANTTLKVAKTVAPYAGYADTAWNFATGKPAFTGEASIEYMIRDAASNDLVAAGADRRVGGTQVSKATVSSWGDVQNILTYWSDAAVYFLCVGRGARDCVKPKEGLVSNPVK